MSIYSMLFVSALFLVGFITESQSCSKKCLLDETQSYPKECKFSRKHRKAECNISNKDVPALPSYVKCLVLTKSNYSLLTKELFKHLKNSSIESLSFRDCNIKGFSSDVFQNLEHLSRFDIIRSHNISAKIVSEINLNLTKVEKLYFMNNNWTSLPEKMFQKSAGSNITLLSISGNRLDGIQKYVFSGLNKLQVLILKSNNFFGDISFEGTPNSVTELNLSKNSLVMPPVFCVSETESYLPLLEILNLQENHISNMEPSSFVCLRNLKELNLKGNVIVVIRKHIIQTLPNLSVLNLSDQSRNVKKIAYNAFDSQSLSVLKFENNDFRFHAMDGILLFSACPNLTYLDLSKNHLKYNSTSIRALFLPVQNLKTLILAETQLTSLPIDLFPHMRSLREIVLTGNDITGWNDDPRVFGNVNWLKKLSMDKNNIKLINKTSFPQNMLSSLESLDLSENKFSCSCRLRWFRNWIGDNGSQILKNWPGKYACKYPPMIAGKALEDFFISEDNCIKPNPVIIAAIVISVVIFVIVIVAGIIDNFCGRDTNDDDDDGTKLRETAPQGDKICGN